MKKPYVETDRVYEFIVAFITNHGYFPTVRETCAGLGLSSTSSVQMHMNKLYEDGRLIRVPGKTKRYRIPGYVFTKVNVE